MRHIFCSLTVLCAVFSLQAQLRFTPIRYNNIVAHEAAKYHSASELAQLRSGDGVDCHPDFGLPIFVSGSGDTMHFRVDTVGFGGGSLTILPCTQFGTVAQLSADTTIFVYTVGSGIEVAIDSICIEYCNTDGSDCHVKKWAVLVRRAGTTSFNPQITLGIEQSGGLVADTSLLPGPYSCQSFTQFYPDLGDVSAVDAGALTYIAARFNGLDTVCYVMCDIYGVCDTLIAPFKVIGDTLGLPFLDDFSYQGPYPARQLWADDNAYVNQTFAYQPPSIGVATLDGLDKTGTPYGSTNGRTDVLTSAYIDLSPFVGDIVYLSFFAQPGGNCEGVEFPDSLVLEFKTANNEWVRVDTLRGTNNLQGYVPPFRYEWFQINQPAYLYKGFQFRFVSYGDKSGITDPWHIDYVRLDETPHTDPTFEDIAFTKLPDSPIKPYTSLPWWQFAGHEGQYLRDSIDVNLFNHFSVVEGITDSRANMRERYTNELLFDPAFVFTTGNIDPGIHIEKKAGIVGFTGYKLNVEALDDDLDSAAFDMLCYITNANQIPFDAVLRNDTVRTSTYFRNYYAYDDGSAERALAADGAGTQIAVGFESNVDDTLRAVQIFFPHINTNVSDQYMRLRVWSDSLQTDPLYEGNPIQVFYPDVFLDTLQGFTTFVFDTAIYLHAGRFYVGWEQISNSFNPIPLGYDLGNPDAADSIWLFTNLIGSWQNVGPDLSIKGAIMMRPVVGMVTPPCTECLLLTDDARSSTFRIWPNPTNGLLQTDAPEGTSYSLYNAAGSMVQRGEVRGAFDFRNLPDGLYFLRSIDISGQVSVQRVVLAK